MIGATSPMWLSEITMSAMAQAPWTRSRSGHRLRRRLHTTETHPTEAEGGGSGLPRLRSLG